MTLAATTVGSPLWFETRASGVVALLMLTISVSLGIVTTLRMSSPRWPRFVTLGLHRNVSLLLALFLVLHVATSIMDPFVHLSWLDAVIPFIAGYRPMWVGLGTVALDLLIAVIITSLLRERLGRRSWRTLHWFTYLIWPVAVVHALASGTDASQRWLLWVVAGCIAIVLGALISRISAGWPADLPIRALAGVAALAFPFLLTAWLVKGPLVPGWAKTAQTTNAVTVPSRLIPVGSGPGSSPASAAPVVPAPGPSTAPTPTRRREGGD